MAVTLTITDESLAGESINEWVITMLTETLTLRELIRSRVYQEVQDFNLNTYRNQGLMQLGQSPASDFKKVDWQIPFEKAIAAFEQQQFLILVNHEQVDDLDQELLLTASTPISFLKMTPLVGG